MATNSNKATITAMYAFKNDNCKLYKVIVTVSYCYIQTII